ncbi:MAG: hypothetical protein M9927_20315 [Anaerolineae bacterium]|nr:hypothetical protein [Anaerolineae bacterium]
MTSSKEYSASAPGLSRRRQLDAMWRGRGNRAFAILLVVAVLLGAAIGGLVASPLVLLAIAGLIGVLLLVQTPALGLVALPLLAIFVPFAVKASADVEINIAVIVIPAIVVVWVLHAMRERRFEIVRSEVNLPALAFLGSAVLSWILGNVYWDVFVPRPHNIILVQFGQFALYAFSFLAMWVAASLLVEQRWLQWMTYSYILFGGIAALLFVPAFLNEIAEAMVAPGAAYSPYWVWLTAMAASQLLFNRRIGPWGKGGLIVILATLLYLTLIKTGLGWVSGFLPMTVVITTLLVMRYPRRAIPLFAAMTVVILANRTALLQSLGLDREIQDSGGGRLGHWTIVWEFARRHPVFGLGLAAYRHYTWSRPDLVAYYLYRGVGVSTHNNYYDIFAFMGVVGLGTFVWFIVAYARMAWRVVQRIRQRWDFDAAYTSGVFAGFLGMLVSGMLGDWFLPFVYNIGFVGFRASVFGWIFMGGLMAVATRLVMETGAGEIQPSS